MDRCWLCNGLKTIHPLGGIDKECTHCKGIGFSDKPRPIPSAISAKQMIKDSINKPVMRRVNGKLVLDQPLTL